MLGAQSKFAETVPGQRNRTSVTRHETGPSSIAPASGAPAVPAERVTVPPLESMSPSTSKWVPFAWVRCARTWNELVGATVQTMVVPGTAAETR